MENKKYYVDFGPELLQLLGPNLYTNIYYVLGEIIANAYDADARNVYILYDTQNNSITVEDDGNGMSYEQFNERYLPIGVTSRTNLENSYTESGERKRMGRKGIGKLAALSVAERVKIISVRDNTKSGCILSLNISQKNNEGRYEIPAIEEKDIEFKYIGMEGAASHGSAVIMENSRYSINKTITSAKKNISMIFPFTNENFRIHINNVNTGESAEIDDYIKDIIRLTDTLITFSDGDEMLGSYYDELHGIFDEDRYFRGVPDKIQKLPEKSQLHQKKPAIRKTLGLKTADGDEKNYELEIYGWIATYSTTSDKKRNTDFPVNYISLLANGKLGQFDILPDISTDRMGEAYVVGQFHVNLLEETELPDIAASNRQGYTSDDLRIISTLELIKKQALLPILYLKANATNVKNYIKNQEKEEKLKASKEKFDIAIRKVVDDPDFKAVIKNSKPVKDALEQGWELKDTIKEAYKKVMISHAEEDKELIDEIEKILHFCGFEKEEILYTSSKYYESGVQAYEDIYEFLKDFFVNTTMKSDLCIIYILNKVFASKWNPVLEAGAGWVLNSKWFPMFTDEFKSVKNPFPATEFTPYLAFNLPEEKQIHYLASAMFQISQHAGKNSQTEQSIFEFIKSTRLYSGS